MAEIGTTRFHGRGEQAHVDAWRDLPLVDPDAARRPEQYVASADLAAAVNVALTLGMPLLLTGEPGSGKSQLAYRLAWELRFEDPGSDGVAATGDSVTAYHPLRFVVKSTTEARDLFYTFDTVGRFHAAQVGSHRERRDDDKAASNHDATDDAVDAVNFIDYQALGLAILRAKGRSRLGAARFLAPRHEAQIPDKPLRSVVLIDEIDKAPRDVPNDILAEIEDMRFVISELARCEIGLDPDDQRYRPVVIITSNSERDLPPAFLRRCVYYHVPFPPFESSSADQVSVMGIVQSRLGARFGNDSLLREALGVFRHLREQEQTLVGKPPSIAELLAWLEYLHVTHFSSDAVLPARSLGALERSVLVRGVQQVLLKSKDDQAAVQELLASWSPRS